MAIVAAARPSPARATSWTKLLRNSYVFAATMLGTGAITLLALGAPLTATLLVGAVAAGWSSAWSP
jgi:hypothetical protein